MKSKTTLAIACLFLFSTILIGYVQGDEEIPFTVPRPPSEPKKPIVVETKVRKETVEKDRNILKELEEKMDKLEAEYKASPEGSEEAQTCMERINAIRKRMVEIRAKSQKARKKRQPRDLRQLLQNQIDQKRKDIKELEDQLVSARRDISDIKKDETGEYPEVRDIERRIKHLQRKLEFDRAVLKELVDKQSRLASQKHRPKPADQARRKAPLDLKLEIFTVSHVNVAYLADLIEPFLTPKVGVIVHCTRTNSIIVRDTAKILKQVAKIVKHVDVPKKEVEERKEK